MIARFWTAGFAGNAHLFAPDVVLNYHFAPSNKSNGSPLASVAAPVSANGCTYRIV